MTQTLNFQYGLVYKRIGCCHYFDLRQIRLPQSNGDEIMSQTMIRRIGNDRIIEIKINGCGVFNGRFKRGVQAWFDGEFGKAIRSRIIGAGVWQKDIFKNEVYDPFSGQVIAVRVAACAKTDRCRVKPGRQGVQDSHRESGIRNLYSGNESGTLCRCRGGCSGPPRNQQGSCVYRLDQRSPY